MRPFRQMSGGRFCVTVQVLERSSCMVLGKRGMGELTMLLGWLEKADRRRLGIKRMLV